MKVIVIGLGSMGKRRIRLLSEWSDITIFGIDSNEERRKEVEERFCIETFSSIAEAVSKKDISAAIISTSPLSHATIIKECLENGLHVFTEINLVKDSYDENMALAREKGLVLFLSSTFLYEDDTLKIIERCHEAKCKMNYIYHVGQYLPDWHPWESYNNYFIGNPRTNGCREIMAIEFPWIVTCFGPIKSFTALKSKNTELNIEYNDNYLITLEHENGCKGVFAVDVVSRNPVRCLDIYGENIQLYWNGSIEGLKEYDFLEKKVKPIDLGIESEHIDGYASFIDEKPYRNELEAYIKQIKSPDIRPVWDFTKDKVILDIIDKIES